MMIHLIMNIFKKLFLTMKISKYQKWKGVQKSDKKCNVFFKWPLKDDVGSISPLCFCFFTQSFQKRKKQSSHQCLFALLGSSCIKVACKMLVKSTPSQGLRQKGKNVTDGGKLVIAPPPPYHSLKIM